MASMLSARRVCRGLPLLLLLLGAPTSAAAEPEPDDPAATPAQLEALAHHPQWTVRSRLAARETLPVEVMRILAVDPERTVRTRLIERVELPTEIGLLLAADPDCDVVDELHDSRDDLAPEIELVMAKGSCRDVRWSLARYGRDPAVRAQLMSDPDCGVRAAVVESQEGAWTKGERTALLQGECVDVRAALASRPGAEPELLATLAKDPDDAVRAAVAAATQDPSLTAQLAQDPSWEVAFALARREDIPPAHLDALAGSSRCLVLEALADNIAASSETLAGLLARVEDCPSLATTLVSNPHTAPETLAALAAEKHAQPWLVARYARSRALMAELVTMDPDTALESTCSSPAATRVAVERWIPTQEFPGSLNLPPQTPGDTLDGLAEIEDRELRANVMAHPNTSEATRARLRRIDDDLLRASDPTASQETLLSLVGRDRSSTRARRTRARPPGCWKPCGGPIPGRPSTETPPCPRRSSSVIGRTCDWRGSPVTRRCPRKGPDSSQPRRSERSEPRWPTAPSPSRFGATWPAIRPGTSAGRWPPHPRRPWPC